MPIILCILWIIGEIIHEKVTNAELTAFEKSLEGLSSSEQLAKRIERSMRK